MLLNNTYPTRYNNGTGWKAIPQSLIGMSRQELVKKLKRNKSLTFKLSGYKKEKI